MKRSAHPASRHHCSRSAAPSSVSAISTALILSGASPASCAARIPVSTDSRRSRRVSSAKCRRSIVSSETLTRESPARARPTARCSRPTALVVIDSGIPGTSSLHPATITSRSRRRSGSPPVNRTSRIPRRCTATPTSRMISSAVSRSRAGIAGSPSAGMQYVHRSEHFSVIDTRRSRATRPKPSSSSGTSGRPSVDGAADRTVGIPTFTAVAVRAAVTMSPSMPPSPPAGATTDA